MELAMEEISYTQPVLSLKNIRKVYPNGYEALSNVSFEVKGGEFICIIGRSGAGKSTLLRCINGLVPITTGNILINGTDITKLSDQGRLVMRRWIGFIFQEFNLVDRISALRNVLLGRIGYINDFKLLQAGLHPDKDLQATFAGSHDVSVLGVISGKTDAGAVASDVFDNLVATNKLKESDVVIISKSDAIPESPLLTARN
jgi:phosphonate transport system ATP-binding protein